MASQTMVPSNPEELQQVLMMLTFPDNDKIKQATKILKKFLKMPECVGPMVAQIQSSQEAACRQMAAILLRQKILTYFTSLGEADRQNIKGILLERLVKETVRPCRNAVAALVASIAKVTVPDGQWDDLLPFLLNLTQSEDKGHRDVAMLLFRVMVFEIGASLVSEFGTLRQIFHKGLSDPSDATRSESLRALEVLAQYIDSEEEVVAFAEVIPAICGVLQASITECDEENVSVVFDVLDTLAESPIPVLNPHMPQLLNLMIEVCKNTQLEITFREKASFMVVRIIERKPGQVTKSKVLGQLLELCMQMSVEPTEDAFAVVDTMTPEKIGMELLDAISLCNNIPKELYFADLMKHAIALTSSANPHDRKGGLIIIAILAEGCVEQMRPDLEQLMGVICQSIRDEHSLVVAAALIALTQFADNFQPDITDYHKMVLPCIFSALDAKNCTAVVKKKSCNALDVFCEFLGQQILQYITPVMAKLLELLQNGDQEVQVTAIRAIKSTASAAQKAFLPYSGDILQLMGSVMQQTSDETLKLRCAATECVGTIGVAIGKEAFGQYLESFLQLAVQGMDLEFFELRESTYTFFGEIATMLGPDFKGLTMTVVPFIIATLESNDGLICAPADGGFNQAGLDGFCSDEEDDDDDEFKGNISIRTGALDEKVAALGCLAIIIEQVGEAFAPFLESSLTSLEGISVYPHHYVRSAAVAALSEILTFSAKAFPNPEKYSPGVATALHPNSRGLVDKIMPLYMMRINDEENKECASVTCEAITECAKHFGLGGIQPYADQLVEALLDLLNERAPCQQSEEDEDESVQADHDEVLIDNVTDVISALTLVGGPVFEPAFRQMFGPILKFLQPQRPWSDRSMAFGCLAEVFENLGEKTVDYTPELFPYICGGLRDAQVSVRRNTSFCAGVLFLMAPQASTPYITQTLECLAPLFNVDENSSAELLACKDNAVSAVAKLIQSSRSSIPMDAVVGLFMTGLPLQSDFMEAKFVYPCLLDLIQTHDMSAHYPKIVSVLCQLLPLEQVEDSIRKQCADALRAMSQQENIRAIGQSLPPAQQEVFQQVNQ